MKFRTEIFPSVNFTCCDFYYERRVTFRLTENEAVFLFENFVSRTQPLINARSFITSSEKVSRAIRDSILGSDFRRDLTIADLGQIKIKAREYRLNRRRDSPRYFSLAHSRARLTANFIFPVERITVLRSLSVIPLPRNNCSSRIHYHVHRLSVHLRDVTFCRGGHYAIARRLL